VVATLRAGVISASEVTTESLSIATTNVTIAGQTLNEYIAQTVSTILNTQYHLQNTNLVSPITEVDQIHTNVISPLAQNSDLIVRLASSSADHNASLIIQNASGSGVASIDTSGNASFSGQLTAQSAKVDEATISGTLRAGKIIADQIEGLSVQTATLAASYVTNIYEATPSATPSIDATSAAKLTLDAVNIATFSSQLAHIDNLNATFGSFTQGLTAYGPTSLSDVSIIGQLALGANFILSQGTINVLGSDLELQPLKQGGLSIMAGLVHIDTDGNVTMGGNATFAKDVTIKGTLSTNIISPIPDSDLVIKLPQDSNASQSGSLVIQNASGSAILKIDQQGSLTASGDATFKNVLANTFNIIRSAQADTSFTDTIATSSAGTATIIQGEKERTIISPFVTEKSLIYITPTSDTQGTTPYIARQTVEDSTKEIKASFTIQIPQKVAKDITLNWWIVN